MDGVKVGQTEADSQVVEVHRWTERRLLQRFTALSHGCFEGIVPGYAQGGGGRSERRKRRSRPSSDPGRQTLKVFQTDIGLV